MTEPQAPAQSPPKSVVYIEDNADNVLLMHRILERRPALQLHDASSGERGLELVRETHPVLVLMDLNVEGLSGLGLLRDLRSLPECQGVPIVIVSGDSGRSRHADLQAAGADEVLDKPFRLAELLQTLDRLAP
ncbi:MAG: histidine kinase [Acidimicrobiia bacterium]|nr:histidine kinase [Acidimicrobiia bacterium]